jgi:tryptophanyl-tRNA synthetase
MTRVFSGIQPSGELHVGNYLGAVQNWIRLQGQHECVFSIVDLHAITQPYEPAELAQRTHDMAVGLLAAGIDPERSILFVQSHVAEHTELNWMLTTVAPLGSSTNAVRTRRAPGKCRPGLNYPVLQADKLPGELVPVGEDQLQHLELMREIARRWNGRYGTGFFPEPQAQLTTAKRVLGLDGQSKMSKSLGNTIGLLESPEAIWEKLRPAATDPARKTRKDPGNPDLCNVFTIHQGFSPPDVQATVAGNCRTAGWGCLDCKRVLADHMIAALAPVRERAAVLRGDPGRVRALLKSGAERARAIARRTMHEVRRHMGLLPVAD